MHMHKSFRYLKLALVGCALLALPAVALAEDSPAAGLGPATSGIGVSNGAVGAQLQPANPQTLQSSAADSLMAPTPTDGVSTLQVAPNQSAVSSYLEGETDPSSRETSTTLSTTDLIAWMELAVIILSLIYVYQDSHRKTRHLKRYYRPEHSHSA